MKKQSVRTKFWFRYHFGLLGFSAIAAMLMKHMQTGNALDPTVVVAFSTIFLTSALIGYLAIYLVKKAEGYSLAELKRKMIPGLILFYTASVLIANVAVSISTFGWFLYIGRDLGEFWHHLFQYELSTANSSIIIWLLFFMLAFFFVLWKKSTDREQVLMEEKLSFQYEYLKSQVNPHFLFNSLNTLSELMHRDVSRADQYIQKLSAVYRYILLNEKNNLVPLNEEIRFVEEFFSLQQERDRDKIILEMEVKDTAQRFIVPVSLQILVENALKHNACSKSNPLKIRISRDAEEIVVSNNIQRKDLSGESTKIGLRNVSERVKCIMNKELSYKEENNQFIVRVPMMMKES
jgi:hypothetical protein